MWLLYAFLSAITAALVAIFAKLGLQNIDSTLATTIRAIIMAGFLVLTSLFLLLVMLYILFLFHLTNNSNSKDYVQKNPLRIFLVLLHSNLKYEETLVQIYII